MSKNLDDEFGRPPVKDPDGLYKTGDHALCWVMGYLAASSGEKPDSCPFNPSRDHYTYWHAGYRAKMNNKRK